MPASYSDRFHEVFSPRMTVDEQLATFSRLRFDIESGAHREEATELLLRLYERPDVAWRVRQSIDEFRAGDPRPDAPAQVPTFSVRSSRVEVVSEFDPYPRLVLRLSCGSEAYVIEYRGRPTHESVTVDGSTAVMHRSLFRFRGTFEFTLATSAGALPCMLTLDMRYLDGKMRGVRLEVGGYAVHATGSLGHQPG